MSNEKTGFHKLVESIKERERKYTPKFFYSNQESEVRRDIAKHHFMMEDSPLYAVLNDGKIVTFTQVIYDDEEAAIRKHKEKYSDSEYLGEGLQLWKAVNKVIDDLEKQFKANN